MRGEGRNKERWAKVPCASPKILVLPCASAVQLKATFICTKVSLVGQWRDELVRRAQPLSRLSLCY